MVMTSAPIAGQDPFVLVAIFEAIVETATLARGNIKLQNLVSAFDPDIAWRSAESPQESHCAARKIVENLSSIQLLSMPAIYLDDN
jgi:hypothetical protein